MLDAYKGPHTLDWFNGTPRLRSENASGYIGEYDD